MGFNFLRILKLKDSPLLWHVSAYIQPVYLIITHIMDSGSNEKRCTFPERIFLYKSGRLYYYFQKSKVDNTIAVGSPSPCLGFLSSGGHSTRARALATSALLFLCHKEGEMTWLIGEFREKPGWFFCPDFPSLSLGSWPLLRKHTFLPCSYIPQACLGAGTNLQGGGVGQWPEQGIESNSEEC